MSEQQLEELKHDVIIKARRRLEMSGVCDVTSYDENEIIVQISNQGVSIEGEGLKIERFNAENGELILNGIISGIFYFSKEPVKKKKSIGNIFK